jgi:hypothetical protein
VKKRSRFYPRVQVDTADVPAVGQAGGVLMTDTVAAAGLDAALSAALAPWHKPLAIHDPGKVILDLALTLALGGDCLADIALLRAEPRVYGLVASDPTVSRCIDALAADAPAALKAINTARAAARGAGVGTGRRACSRPRRRRCLAADHRHRRHPGHLAFGEGVRGVDVQTRVRPPPAVLLPRPRTRGQRGTPGGAAARGERRLQRRRRPHHRRPLRVGPAARSSAGRPSRPQGADPHRRCGASHKFLDWCHGQRLSYSIGFGLPDNTPELLKKIPAEVWTPAYDAHDQIREGAWVAELTGLLDLTGWPPGMRVIARKERPHPGGAAADHRRRRAAGHRVRHQQHSRAAARPGTAAPPPGPGRGPDPVREGHRADQPAAARLRPEPDLVRHRRARV